MQSETDDGAGEEPGNEGSRLPLPAGDALTWSVLVAGSRLEGIAWPGYGGSGWDSPVAGGAL